MNECDGMIHSCQQACINTPGSHVCDCFEGFELSIDGVSCEGLWLKQHNCSFIMVPWTLSINHFMIVHILCVVVAGNECPMSNNCSQVCVLLNGTESCSCLAGFELLTDGTMCQGWLLHTVSYPCIHCYRDNITHTQILSMHNNYIEQANLII